MAGKRTATDDLNHDNWDREGEAEEKGTFQKASEDDLKKRIIKTARRRNPISSVRSDEVEKKSAFSGFTGFQSRPTPGFSFLTNLSKNEEIPKTNGTASPKKTELIPSFSFNKTVEDNSSSNEATGKSDTYYAKLKGLNESVAKWIKSKVEKNPLISLQPIFKDYEKYLDEIESKEKSSKALCKIDTSSMSAFSFKSTSMPVPDSTSEKPLKKQEEKGSESYAQQISFGAAAKTTNASAPTFSFGLPAKSSDSSTTLPPTFSFGSTTSSGSDYSFTNSTTPFSFTNVAKPITETKDNNTENENDDDEPPKVDFTPVVEKDHIYTTRCKVFVKKDGNYSDRGVGNLYLKPIENSDKKQVIVRADTNLGNLICNFILSESIPIQRLGKKDVMLVCLPTPETQPPPVPILLRVKSPEDADSLLEILEKHKK